MAALSKLLIANRGEIACRIIRTCRQLGIATAAVYSEADAGARHVRMADEAWPIGGAAPAASYLDIERLLEAAALAGADAVHPGYGFLSENAAFAAAVRAAGLIFVGPAADTIALMGSKAASRQRMREAGVPVLPGYDDDDQRDEVLAAQAEQIGYPVLIKASAGGGGRGMRVVHDPSAFVESALSARREASAAFGDDRLIVERYLVEPRHVEVQIIGDAEGNLVHLFERECSVQRRHQKIIEESPSPFLDDTLRTAMTAAAVEAARAVNYENAGTVEFIVDRDRRFYFMEMNTRLQVEHPVTEMITGIDLVAWQLRVAAGEPLPRAQEAITRRGHALECRLYAERPEQGFLPATGHIEAFVHPACDGQLRIDSGVETGDAVTVHYDPMIAKLAAWGPDRDTALERMRTMLARTTVVGVDTNIALLGELLVHPRFRAGEVDTTFVDRELDTLVRRAGAVDDVQLVAAAVHLLASRREAAGHAPGPGAAPAPGTVRAGADAAAAGNERVPGDAAFSSAAARSSPWDAVDHWRASGLSRRRLRFGARDGRSWALRVGGALDAAEVEITDEDGARCLAVNVSGNPARERFAITMNGQPRAVTVQRHAHRLLVEADGRVTELDHLPPYPVDGAAPDEEVHPTAPMPGRVVSVAVSPGASVREGDALLTLEGMKMEYTLRARRGGVIDAVHCAVGDTVDADVPLVSLREEGA